MYYINKQTGAIIDVQSKITSTVWEKLEKASPEVEEVKEAPKKKTRGK